MLGKSSTRAARSLEGTVVLTFVFLLGLTLGSIARPANAESPAPPMPDFVRDVAKTVGFDDDDVEKVWVGDIVSTTLKGKSDKELAIAVMMRLQENHPDFYERAQTGLFFEVDSTILQSEEIPATSKGAAVFSGLRLDASELRRLGQASPGAEFNLTKAESMKLRQAGQLGDEAVLASYREVLAGRLSDYREKGIEGVSSYARGHRGEARPAQDLRLAISSLAGLAERCPRFYGSFAEYPIRRDPAVNHRFFWAVQQVQGRPTVILSHWALQLHDEFAIVGQRQFFVGQGYDALQILVGAFSTGDDESLVFYLNRTSTDQVAGFGSSVAHLVGGKVMLTEVTALFRDLRRSAAEVEKSLSH